MKQFNLIRFTTFLLFLFGGMMLRAQEQKPTNTAFGNDMQNYLTKTNVYAALYSGKTATPYDTRFTNHPYYESSNYISGILDYNGVLYHDVLMRFDLFRNEITVISPDKSYDIVLDNDKFNYAVVNGSAIMLSVSEKELTKQLLVLLHNGIYPVVRKYVVNVELSQKDRIFYNTFLIQRKYDIYINDVPRTVKNKNSVLKLFPDKRKELNEFAKQHNLNFKNQIEQSFVALVTHYENLTSQEGYTDDADNTDFRR